MTIETDVESRKKKLKDEINNCMRKMHEEDQSQLSQSNIITLPAQKMMHFIKSDANVDFTQILDGMESSVEDLMVDCDNVLFQF